MTTPDTGVGPEPGAHPADPQGPSPGRRLVTTTVSTPSPTIGRHAAPEGNDGATDDTTDDTTDGTTDDAAERGSLTIHGAVVEKVATAAASEIEYVGGATRRVLGVSTGREDGDGHPRVSAKVSGQVTSLEIRLAIAYPASVRATSEAVRAHVRDRVQALTELTVTRVDITVAVLTATRTSAKRVVA